MKIEHNHEHHEKATGNLIFVFILNITFNVDSYSWRINYKQCSYSC